MSNISAVIVVKDNPPHLPETLESLDFVDEIILIDIGMSNECKNRIQQWNNITIKPIDENITYVEQIRERVKQFARHEIILFLDPDEVVTPGVRDELVKNMNKYDYIAIPRKNIIFNKWIEHSRWWPDYQIRLFKKDAVIWPQQLHAQPVITGNGYTIEPAENKALLHYNYNSIDEFATKMLRYARSEAKELIDQRKKYSISISIKEGLQEFMSRFFAEKGYKDGMHGLVLAFMQMIYKLFVFFYYWENLKYAKVDRQELIEAPQLFFKQGLYESNHWLTQEKLITKATEFRNRIINKIL